MTLVEERNLRGLEILVGPFGLEKKGIKSALIEEERARIAKIVRVEMNRPRDYSCISLGKVAIIDENGEEKLIEMPLLNSSAKSIPSHEMMRRNALQWQDVLTHFALHYNYPGGSEDRIENLVDAFLNWSSPKDRRQLARVFAVRYQVNRNKINNVCDKLCGECQCKCSQRENVRLPIIYDPFNSVVEIKDINPSRLTPIPVCPNLTHHDSMLLLRDPRYDRMPTPKEFPALPQEYESEP
jgi:hypothetical protein